MALLRCTNNHHLPTITSSACCCSTTTTTTTMAILEGAARASTHLFEVLHAPIHPVLLALLRQNHWYARRLPWRRLH